jgi:hypothetical protein
MHSLRFGCGRSVRKLWLVCVQSAHFYPGNYFTNSSMGVSGGLYSQLLSYFSLHFSTVFFYNLSQLFAYFYSVSTVPTKTTTSFLKLFKPLVAVKEPAI